MQDFLHLLALCIGSQLNCASLVCKCHLFVSVFRSLIAMETVHYTLQAMFIPSKTTLVPMYFTHEKCSLVSPVTKFPFSDRKVRSRNHCASLSIQHGQENHSSCLASGLQPSQDQSSLPSEAPKWEKKKEKEGGHGIATASLCFVCGRRRW